MHSIASLKLSHQCDNTIKVLNCAQKLGIQQASHTVLHKENTALRAQELV